MFLSVEQLFVNVISNDSLIYQNGETITLVSNESYQTQLQLY